MTGKAAISGDYTDLRFVKGRKVAQIIVEIPIEAAGQFVEAFGTPMPDRNVPVALALIDMSVLPRINLQTEPPLKEQLKASVEHEKRKWSELSRAQQAGIACNEQAFQRYLNEEHSYDCSTPEKAAEAVRAICGVESRADLDIREYPGKLWDELYRHFKAWLTVPA